MKLLKDILYKAGIEELHGNTSITVSIISANSSKIISGALFVAIKGTQNDGHTYIEAAIKSGATSIVCQILPKKIIKGVTYIRVKNSAASLGQMAANYYDNPSEKIKVIGVTGTNGKTTVATLLYNLFRKLGYSCGLLSTVRNRINDQTIPSTHTTPDPLALQALLSAMLDEGCSYCFMEVSSHAIDQQRVAGVDFSGGIFTNLSHDHLDYHKTIEAYFNAKKAFFDMLPSTAFALTNVDDPKGLAIVSDTKALVQTYSLHSSSDFKCRILENTFEGLELNVDGHDVSFRLIGSFNAYNLLAVYGAAIMAGEDSLYALTALSSLSAVEGRFEYIRSENNITAIVDYAHTPDALQNVLETIRDIRNEKERIITVIGCGGDRDVDKRPVMARIAVDLSDKTILTSDNPRSENPIEIIEQMEKGISANKRINTLSISDRREAIRTACSLAQPGDIILVAGKGHENYQEIQGVKHPFDDKQVIKEMFNLKDPQ